MKTLTNIVHSAKFLFYNRELSERTTNVKTWSEVSKFLMLANAIASNTFTIATHFITFACLLVKNAVFTFYSLNPSSSQYLISKGFTMPYTPLQLGAFTMLILITTLIILDLSH